MNKAKSNTRPTVTNTRLLSSKHTLSMIWVWSNWDWGGMDGVDAYVSREANVPTFCVSYYASFWWGPIEAEDGSGQMAGCQVQVHRAGYGII